jgi:hypothetical protein
MPGFACLCCKRLALEMSADGQHLPADVFCGIQYTLADVRSKASRHVLDSQSHDHGNASSPIEASNFAISQTSYQGLNNEVSSRAANDALFKGTGDDTVDEFVWRQSFKYLYPECERFTMGLDPHSYDENSLQVLATLRTLPSPWRTIELRLIRCLDSDLGVQLTSVEEESQIGIKVEIEMKLFSTEISTVEDRMPIYPRDSLEPWSIDGARGSNEKKHVGVMRSSNELVQGAVPRGSDELQDIPVKFGSVEISMEDLDSAVKVKREIVDDLNDIGALAEYSTPEHSRAAAPKRLFVCICCKRIALEMQAYGYDIQNESWRFCGNSQLGERWPKYNARQCLNANRSTRARYSEHYRHFQNKRRSRKASPLENTDQGSYRWRRGFRSLYPECEHMVQYLQTDEYEEPPYPRSFYEALLRSNFMRDELGRFWKKELGAHHPRQTYLIELQQKYYVEALKKLEAENKERLWMASDPGLAVRGDNDSGTGKMALSYILVDSATAQSSHDRGRNAEMVNGNHFVRTLEYDTDQDNHQWDFKGALPALLRSKSPSIDDHEERVDEKQDADDMDAVVIPMMYVIDSHDTDVNMAEDI